MGLRGVGLPCEKYSSLLQACAKMKSLAQGKQVHAHMLASGTEQNSSLESKLVNMYVKCGSMADARLAFDKMPKRNVSSWNVMIGGYAKHGRSKEALALYFEMQQASIHPDNYTFSCILNACACFTSLRQGKEIHDDIIRSKLKVDVVVENALIDMFFKCGSKDDAHHVFDKMSQRDVVSWTAMVAGYAQNGCPREALRIFYQMQRADVKPNSLTLASVIPACGHLALAQQGKEIHGYIIRRGFESDVFVGNALMDMYVKCGSMKTAQFLFDKMSQRDVVSWNAMIAGYAQLGHFDETLKLFHQMQLAGVKIDVITWNTLIAGFTQNGHDVRALEIFQQMQLTGVKPNEVTIASVLPACANIPDLQQGKEIHDYVSRSGISADVCVGNALIDMYVKCDCLHDARLVFDNLPKKTVVSWTSMISGYFLNGLSDEAVKLFRQMKLMGTEPNVITWNALIAGYTLNEHRDKALKSFQQMQCKGVKPNSVSLVSVLPACAHLAALQQGREIHNYGIKSGFESDVLLANALIDMYSKCGNLNDAYQVFDGMPHRTVVSWTAMIACYGMHGHGEDALTLFYQMQQAGMKPNHVTFTCILSACSHAGLMEEGWQYFNLMTQDYHITPSMRHYACIVDLLGRAGRLDAAMELINSMPVEPNAIVWGAMLSACRVHCNIELGEKVAKCLFDLEPENAGNYVLLSNIYALAGRWADVQMVRELMNDRRLKKIPGCSWIEIKNRVYPFYAGDRSHSQIDEIYAMLETLAG
eukprot:Gb_28200 [translate_table: standard]